MKPYLFSLILGIGLLLPVADARTWTSSDGAKTFKAELQSYDEESGKVVVKRINGTTMKFQQSILSEQDIEFLKTEGKALLAKKGGGSKTAVKEVPDVLPDPDGKDADMSKPVKVFILMGQSNMVGAGKVAGLKAATGKGLYPYLVDDAGNWTVRKDVRNTFVMCSGSSPAKDQQNDWMTIQRNIGPEIGIGHYVGHVLDEPVLILKSCIGNRSLGYDLLSPSAVGTGVGGKSYEGNKDDPTRTPKAGDWYAGVQYDGDTKAAKDVLKNLSTYYPGAKKFEVAGFFFWQGAKDLNPATGSAENYEVNLVHLIKDLRKDFNAPDAPFVCATMGQEKKGGKITDAQLAVDGKTGKYPEFKGNVATFYSNPVSKGGSANGHYGGNAETYMNIGEGMGRLMAELLAK
ncbi:MAG: sialate O-acetylesterase [Akkermansiaceae bacterium]